MAWLHGVRRYVRIPSRGKRQIQRDVDDELSFHLEMRAREFREAGLSDDRAKVEALRRFGNVADAREYCEEQDRQREGTRRWNSVLEEAWQDAGIALRQLRRHRLFATAALLTLALGIGANTAIYTLVNAYLIRPFPFPNDDRIAWVYPAPTREMPDNLPNFERVDWRAVESTFDGTVAWNLDAFTLLGGNEPELVYGAWVTPGYFDVLGVRTSVGRTLSADDYRASNRVGLISHALWTRRYNQDPKVIGQTIRMYSADAPMDAELVTIVGVLAADAWHINRFTDLLLPQTDARMPSLARLRPGMTVDEAARRMTSIVRAQLPASTDRAWRMSLRPLRDEYTFEVRPMLLALAAAGGLLLLLTCANVGGLLAARGAARTREMSVRAALGAGRGRLARQLLVEATVLTMIAGAMGISVAQVSVRAVAGTVQRQLGITVPGGEANLRVDASVLAVAILVSAIVVILIGARNALKGSRSDLGTALRMAGAGAGNIDRRNRGRILTVQVALAFALLVGAGLTLRSAAAMADVELGFDPNGVTKAHVLLSVPRYPKPVDQLRTITNILDRVAADPNVASAATVFPYPFRAWGPEAIATEGAATGTQAPQAIPHNISPTYFDVMRIPLMSGRAFGKSDAGGPPVAIVSTGLAQRLWPGANPIGRRLRIGDAQEWRTVVGVVGDVRKTITGQQFTDVYVSMDQQPSPYTALVVRGRGDAASTSAAIRRSMLAVDASIAPSEIGPLGEVIGNETARPRALATLLTGFAAFALVLAALGLGAAMANIVVQRQRELAVRMAIGATGSQVLRLLLGDTGRVLAVGLALGVLMAYGLSRVLSSQLFGVSRGDPWTYVVVALVLGGFGLVAAALPGMRATRIDPASALRDA